MRSSKPANASPNPFPTQNRRTSKLASSAAGIRNDSQSKLSGLTDTTKPMDPLKRQSIASAAFRSRTNSGLPKSPGIQPLPLEEYCITASQVEELLPLDNEKLLSFGKENSFSANQITTLLSNIKTVLEKTLVDNLGCAEVLELFKAQFLPLSDLQSSQSTHYSAEQLGNIFEFITTTICQHFRLVTVVIGNTEQDKEWREVTVSVRDPPLSVAPLKQAIPKDHFDFMIDLDKKLQEEKGRLIIEVEKEIMDQEESKALIASLPPDLLRVLINDVLQAAIHQLKIEFNIDTDDPMKKYASLVSVYMDQAPASLAPVTRNSSTTLLPPPSIPMQPSIQHPSQPQSQSQPQPIQQQQQQQQQQPPPSPLVEVDETKTEESLQKSDNPSTT